MSYGRTDKGRSDYGGKKKGVIDAPLEKGNKGIMGPNLPGGFGITKKAKGKGGVASPTEEGDKGKLMLKKGGSDSGNPPVEERD